jgi:hypothetical protein
MRPDGVMRTSVVQPIFGYDPNADVMAVAQAFTQGPPSMGQLNGLGMMNPFSKIKLWFQSLIASVKAKQFQAIAGPTQQPSPPGPEQNAASQIAPQMQAQMQMLNTLSAHLNQGQMVGPLRHAANELRRRRWNTYYYAG